MSGPLTKAQLKTLAVLDEHEEVVEKRIMSLAGIGGPQGTHAILRTLIARGLVDRELVQSRSPLDSFYKYRITQAGREAVA